MNKKYFFCGIGAQKAATSWLYACLYEHPDVFAPIKEMHFFSREYNWTRGIDWYYSRFNGQREKKFIGEFSTSYLYSPIAAERINRFFPDAKILMVVRDPVERAYSNYQNDLMDGTVEKDTTFDDALMLHPEYVDNGLYGKHIEPYVNLFGLDKIKIIDYEDICNDPLKTFQDVCIFMGIEDDFIPWALKRRINESKIPKLAIVDNTIMKISNFFMDTGFHKIRWVLKKTKIADYVRFFNTDKQKKSNISNGIDLYTKYFKSDIRRFEEITGHCVKLKYE